MRCTASRDQGFPPMVMVPASGAMMPMMLRMRVDLPAPFGPSKPMMDPWGTSKETPSRTCCCP